MFPRDWRNEALSRLGEIFDLVIIGGGITGAGVLMDAAQRGLRVLLLDKEDIASGTSSRSSKLIHGGLRYLKQMQFSITRLACLERDRMLVLNPGLVRPIRFVYPAREDDAVPGWTVHLGLWMYDRLTKRKEKHSHLDADEAQSLVPGLDVGNLERALAYTDGVADDASLTLAVAATGFGYGGLVLTRAEALEPIRRPDGSIGGVVARDLETDEVHRIEARVVVNATGVWTDALRHRFGFAERRLRPSRGSHIILPPKKMNLAAAVAIPSPDDARPVFLVPHPEGILVGTTDLYHEGALDDPRPSHEEISYLLRALRAHFPSLAIAEQDIVGAFAGLRPILDVHAETPSEASREEDVWAEAGMLSVAGGKLTTWRATAERTVDEALELLPEDRASSAAVCHTKGTSLLGLAPRDLAERLRVDHELSEDVAGAMARRLRSRAWWCPRVARNRKELWPLLEGSDVTASEVRVHLATGAILRLEDLLLRRLRVGLWDPELARALAPKLRGLVSKEMGWSRRRWAREVDAFETSLEGWTPRGVSP